MPSRALIGAWNTPFVRELGQLFGIVGDLVLLNVPTVVSIIQHGEGTLGTALHADTGDIQQQLLIEMNDMMGMIMPVGNHMCRHRAIQRAQCCGGSIGTA
jgi:hypothetical protein